MSKEKSVECFIRRALIYCEGMDNDKQKEELVIENLKKAIETINSDQVNCCCKCK